MVDVSKPDSRPTAPRAGGRPVRFLRTWLVAGALWIAAALYRIHQRLETELGWNSVLHERITWIGIVAPLLLLAIVLITIRICLRHLSRKARG